MYGAIIGDLAGSIYEFDQYKETKKIDVNKLISDKSFFSDDTILTIALLDAIISKENYGNYLKKYGVKYMDYKPDIEPYFEKPFSPSFTKWVNSKEEGYSKGNGAMMRISPIGYLYNDEEIIRQEVIKATIPSHNSSEAINCATIIALIIFYARIGYSKEKIISELNLKLEYNDFKKFNLTCSDTINNCLYALFTSNSFEESLLKVISYGGDTDTNACIVGSMAEALYGIDESLIKECDKKIPDEFVKILKLGYSRIK